MLEISKKTLEENLLDLEKGPLSWHWNVKQKGNAVKMKNCAMKPGFGNYSKKLA
ncbi:MAG: hypothetical protein K8R34_01965 [Methanosarcinales archaeon]|nr:hypothetical protein [Methanosarcinales archaeon]